jgi:hypothetical protein
MTNDRTLHEAATAIDKRLDALGQPGPPITPANAAAAAARKHSAQSTADTPQHWPTGVRPVSVEGLGLLGVSEDGRLYWDGIPVEVARTFTLSWWQRLAAILVSLSAVIAAGAACVSAYADIASK